MIAKDFIRSALMFLHFDLTKNLEYDRYTKLILRKVLHSGSNCVDVGCHKGEMLHIIIRFAPKGTHYAFEPLTPFYEKLKIDFPDVRVFPYALSDTNGVSAFQYVRNAPAYSGFRRRRYDVETPDIEEIQVEIKRLDDLIPENLRIDLIKIDVEGAEFAVLRGALKLLVRCKPVVIFECGLGASDYYDTKPQELFEFLTVDAGLKVSLLKSFINGEKPLSGEEFVDIYASNSEYYFVAGF